MKKRTFLCLLLIVLCIAAWVGYRTLDRFRTDHKAPEIQVQEMPLTISVQDSRDLLLQGISAVDNEDGDVTDSLIVESIRLLDASTGKISVNVAAFDQSGNVAKAVREATFSDYRSPRFSLKKAMVYTQNTSFDPMDALVARDDLDGDITYRIRATAMDNSSSVAPGIRRIQFRVTNSLGDTTVVELPVEVIEPNTYNAQLELTNYMVYLKVGEQFSERQYLDSFQYSTNDPVSLKEGLPVYYSLKTYGVVNTNVPGIYTLAYELTYDRTAATGYEAVNYVAYSKIIVVVEE